MTLSKEKRLRLPGLVMSFSVDDRVGRIVGTPYRSAARWLGVGKETPASRNGVAREKAVVSTAPLSPDGQRIAQEVSKLDWYHVIDLPHGVVTPGRADHRRQKHLYGLPEDMTGMRVLDVATFDGFWAFEMERRGADVTAVDIGRWSQADIPLRWKERMTVEEDTVTGAGFRMAADLLNSKVQRREMSVYDLDADELGQFDLVMLSDLLLHIRDPQLALEKLWTVIKNPGGHAIIAEPYSPQLENAKGMALTQWIGYEKFVWQIPSTATLRSQLHQAGFEPVEELDRFRLDYDHPFPIEKVVFRAFPRAPGTNGTFDPAN